MKSIFCFFMFLTVVSSADERPPHLNKYCDSKLKFVSAELSFWSILYFTKIYKVSYEAVDTKETTTAFVQDYPKPNEPKYIYISYAPPYISQIFGYGSRRPVGDYAWELEDGDCVEVQKDISNVKNIKSGSKVSELKSLGYKRTNIESNVWTYQGDNKLKLSIEVSGVSCDSQKICEDENIQQFSKLLDYRIYLTKSRKQ